MDIKTGVYKHFKGGTVLVYGLAFSSENNEPLVLYVGMQDKTHHARPLNSFVEVVKFNNQNVNRFSLVEAIELNLNNEINKIISRY